MDYKDGWPQGMFCLTGKSNHNGQFKSKILFQKVFIILILNLENFFFFFFISAHNHM